MEDDLLPQAIANNYENIFLYLTFCAESKNEVKNRLFCVHVSLIHTEQFFALTHTANAYFDEKKS